jgi:hypothetical protein
MSKNQHKSILASSIVERMDKLKDLKSKESLMIIWFLVSMLAWMAGLKVIEYLVDQIARPRDLASGFLFFSAVIGLITSLVQWPFLRIIFSIRWFYWVGATTLGFALGGVAGIFSGGLMSGLPVIAMQIFAFREVKKNINIWVISNLVTSLILGVVFFCVIFLSITASDYANPFSLRVFIFTGFIYGLGTAIAFGSLCKQSQSPDIT